MRGVQGSAGELCIHEVHMYLKSKQTKYCSMLLAQWCVSVAVPKIVYMGAGIGIGQGYLWAGWTEGSEISGGYGREGKSSKQKMYYTRGFYRFLLDMFFHSISRSLYVYLNLLTSHSTALIAGFNLNRPPTKPRNDSKLLSKFAFSSAVICVRSSSWLRSLKRFLWNSINLSSSRHSS